MVDKRFAHRCMKHQPYIPISLLYRRSQFSPRYEKASTHGAKEEGEGTDDWVRRGYGEGEGRLPIQPQLSSQITSSKMTESQRVAPLSP
jgi:hypothetical protein